MPANETRVTLITHDRGDLIFIGDGKYAGDSYSHNARLMICELSASGCIVLDIIKCGKGVLHPYDCNEDCQDLQDVFHDWKFLGFGVLLKGAATDRRGLDFEVVNLAAPPIEEGK